MAATKKNAQVIDFTLLSFDELMSLEYPMERRDDWRDAVAGKIVVDGAALTVRRYIQLTRFFGD